MLPFPRFPFPTVLWQGGVCTSDTVLTPQITCLPTWRWGDPQWPGLTRSLLKSLAGAAMAPSVGLPPTPPFLRTKYLVYLERLLINYNWFWTIMKVRFLFSKHLLYFPHSCWECGGDRKFFLLDKGTGCCCCFHSASFFLPCCKKAVFGAMAAILGSRGARLKDKTQEGHSRKVERAGSLLPL